MKDLQQYIKTPAIIVLILTAALIAFESATVAGFGSGTMYWLPYVPLITTLTGTAIYMALHSQPFKRLSLIRQVAAYLILPLLVWYIGYIAVAFLVIQG